MNGGFIQIHVFVVMDYVHLQHFPQKTLQNKLLKPETRTYNKAICKY